MTQQELADAVGVSLRSISAWERGESVPRSKMPVVMDILGPFMVSSDKRQAVANRLGQLCRQRREEIGLSRPRLAAETKTSVTTIQNLEQGLRVPTSLTLRAVEKALDWVPGAYMSILGRAAEINPADIRMEHLDGAQERKDSPRVVKLGLEEFTVDELLAEVSKRHRLVDMKLRLATQGVEVPEPSEFRERPDYGLAANDDMTGGDDDLEN